MFCPQCRVEYRTGFSQCSDCQVALVDELPVAQAPTKALPSELVTVLEASDLFRLGVAKSLLEAAGIQYLAKGEALQDLFAVGRLGINPIVGPVELQVAPEDEEQAKEVLLQLEAQDIEEPMAPSMPSSDAEGIQTIPPTFAWLGAQRLFRGLVIVKLALLFVPGHGNQMYQHFPPELLVRLETLYYSQALARFSDQVQPFLLLVAVVVLIGLALFWSPARYLYIAVWVVSLFSVTFSAAHVSYGLTSLVWAADHLLGGAIVAIVFLSPLKQLFEKRSV